MTLSRSQVNKGVAAFDSVTPFFILSKICPKTTVGDIFTSGFKESYWGLSSLLN